MPRKKPYTEIGIKRVPCFRCSDPSVHQWQVCALNNDYHGLCKDCDFELNKLVLEFMGIPKKEAYCLMEDYRFSYIY